MSEERKSTKQKQKDAREQRRLDLASVLAQPAGRRFVWTLLRDVGVFGSQFSVDPLANAFGAGRRAVGVELMAAAQVANRDDYVRMLLEEIQAAEPPPEPAEED